jgi:hypothetical protein
MQADKSQLQQNILAAPVYSPMPMPLPVQAVGPRSITNEAAAAMVAERGETVILEGIFSPSFVQYTLACACLGIFGSFMWPFFLLIPCILMGIKAQYQSFKVGEQQRPRIQCCSHDSFPPPRSVHATSIS